MNVSVKVWYYIPLPAILQRMQDSPQGPEDMQPSVRALQNNVFGQAHLFVLDDFGGMKRLAYVGSQVPKTF